MGASRDRLPESSLRRPRQRLGMKLTTQEIARYRPPQGKADHIVFDEELSGFGLRYRAGKRVWIYQYAFGSGKARVKPVQTD